MSKKNTVLESLEDPDALAGQLTDKAEDIFVKYRNPILGVLGAIVLVVAGFVGYRYWVSTQNEEAQATMFPSVFRWEADSLRQALNGNGANPGLLAVADEYGATSAGNLAHFYAGVGLLKEGKYDEAINHLKDFKSSDLLVQARAYALVGDAYMEKKSFDEAADYYKKAADYKPNKFFTPSYLMKLAIAYEQAKQTDKAIDAYDQILTKFADSAEAPSAKKYKSVLEATAGES